MNFLHTVLLACLMVVQIEPLQAKCKEPLQGPPGPQGPQGVPGPKTPIDSLFHYSNLNIVPIGTAVPFNQTPSISGTSILAIANSSFSFTTAGAYFVSFIGYADFSGAGVIFTLNGVPTGPAAAVQSGALNLQQIISVQPGDTLQVITTQDSVFAENASITINIMKLL